MARALVANVACPLLSVPVPSVAAPSLKVTVPVGVPPDVTVAVSVTGVPNVVGLADAVTPVELEAWVTVCVKTADVLPV
jgi:hypothetical protein